MFVQEIQGHVSDATQARAALGEWQQEIAPGADGWLGTTAGVTENGEFLALVRFESQEAGQRNGERPEVDKWWGRMQQLFTQEPVLRFSEEVDVDVVGELDDAGFVQITQGRTNDPDRARELMSSGGDAWAEFRPDVLGSFTVTYEGGAYTAVIYFSSEAEAREGEKKTVPAELEAQMAEMGVLSVGEAVFYDIAQPVLQSP